MSFSLLDYDFLEVRNFIFTLSEGLELHLKHEECVHSCSVLSDSLQTHGLWPARLLHPWNFPSKNTGVVAIFFSRGSSWVRDWTWISCIGRRILYHCTTWEALETSVKFSSITQSCPILCNPMDCSTPGLPVHHQHPEFTQTHVYWIGDAIQPSHPLSSPSPPTFMFLSIRVFSNESVLLIRWPKYWSFSFNISSFREYLGLISFRMDWLDLLAVQGTLCLITIS